MKFKFCTIINCIDISEYGTHVLNLNATKVDFIKQNFDGAIKITKTNETLTQIKLICVILFTEIAKSTILRHSLEIVLNVVVKSSN